MQIGPLFGGVCLLAVPAESGTGHGGIAVSWTDQADPRIVQALAAVGMQPAQLIAQAFGGLAENAGRIGQLNLSPDLLQALMGQGIGQAEELPRNGRERSR